MNDKMLNTIIDIFKDIIRENSIDIDMKEDLERLKAEILLCIDENKFIKNDIHEAFQNCEKYFMFYEGKETNEIISGNILNELKNDSFENNSFDYVNLYVLFDNMKRKMSFDKYYREEKVAKEILKELKEKGWSLKAKDIVLNTIFIGNDNDKSFNIEIYDRIRSLEYHGKKILLSGNEEMKEAEEEGLKITGFVFNAKLKDIVSIYNYMGNELFDRNIRYSIKDELDVDSQIKNTLKNKSDEFWYLNNGITMIVEDDEFKLRRSDSIKINYKKENIISIINGAQTVSAAAAYFYDYDKENEDDNKDNEAKVIFRIILINKLGCTIENKDKLENLLRKQINNISISLNRQKPIKQEDIAYTSSFVDNINQLSEESKQKDESFKIIKRGEETEKGYDLLQFAKIVKSYLAQKPGTALTKGAKTLLKLNNGELADSEIFKDDKSEEDDKDIFVIYYRPVNFAAKLIDLYYKFAKEIVEKKSMGSICQKIASYGKLYFTAYIIYILNGKNNNSFETFDVNYKGLEENIEYIIERYIELFSQFISFYHHDNITASTFKNDALYLEFRNCEHLYEKNERIEDLKNIKEFHNLLSIYINKIH